jgi:LuxR family maltose regulon positive regulatory protein
MWTTQVRTFLLPTIARLGNMETVEQVFAEMDEKERGTAQMRIALAGVRLVQGDLEGATVALAPVVDGTVPTGVPALTVQAFLLEARARERLGDAGAADRALERALDLAEPEGFRLQFLLVPAPELLERHSRRRTSHASLVQEIRMLLSGETRPASSTPDRLREPLSESETRVLRYLPTNLSVPEIASEIYLSVNTVKTHIRHLYGKLETHGRRDAVERARQLGLLAPSSRKA